jgi:hypothetical protein
MPVVIKTKQPSAVPDITVLRTKPFWGKCVESLKKCNVDTKYCKWVEGYLKGMRHGSNQDTGEYDEFTALIRVVMARPHKKDPSIIDRIIGD